ncbi:MAG: HAD domain-containing protein [Lachnospiraceae bacterium]|nr:HAD domain-containing protein [Lachnospiraceae bacterium]
MYIFLDMDGVLNKESDWHKKFYINPDCLCNFEELIKKLIRNNDIQIILTSTWRQGVSGLDDSILLPLNSMLNKYNLRINDCTVKSNKTRQEEIEYYIRRHNVDKYIILDDDEKLFPDKNNVNLYLINYKTGFCSRDVSNIIKVIKKYGK